MKKLKLQRQTVRVLTIQELRIAGGGVETVKTGSCMHVCDPWPPPPTSTQ